MEARMKNPAMVIPEAMQAILALQAAAAKGGVPSATLQLVHLRVNITTKQIAGSVEW